MKEQPKIIPFPISGTIKKSIAIEILKRHGVTVSRGEKEVLISKGHIIEVMDFPDLLHRRMIHRLARRFEIPIHLFYNPGK